MQTEYEMAEVISQRVESETPNRPAAVVETFVRLIEAGEIESAIGLLSERVVEGIGFQRLESIFSQGSLEIWSLGGIESVELQTLAFSRDHVEMRLTIWYGDHKVESDEVDLVRENDRWRIWMKEATIVVMDPLGEETHCRRGQKRAVLTHRPDANI